MISEHSRRRARRLAGWVLSLSAAIVVVVFAWPKVEAPWRYALPLVPAVVALAWDRGMRPDGGVTALMYHSVSADAAWLPGWRQLSVSPETFARQLSVLERKGLPVISTDQLLAARLEGGDLPARAVVIHLDDGYLDNWVAALPVLERFQYPATVFVSLDFIDPDDEVRPTLCDVDAQRVSAEELRWDGYLNWEEIRRMEASGLIDIAAHGTDHGRVEIGPRIVDEIRPDNWRRLAWVQWAAMPGGKSDWYRHAEPPAVPYGTPVRESAPALAGRRWRHGERESRAAYLHRVEDVLRRSRSELERELGHGVRVFCWPQNTFSREGRSLARAAGYWATAAGILTENRAEDDPTMISRVHSGERLLPWRWPWGEDLAFYAKVRVHQGNYYWYLLLGSIYLMGKVWRRWQSR